MGLTHIERNNFKDKRLCRHSGLLCVVKRKNVASENGESGFILHNPKYITNLDCTQFFREKIPGLLASVCYLNASTISTKRAISPSHTHSGMMSAEGRFSSRGVFSRSGI
jgi:hypothetical protein